MTSVPFVFPGDSASLKTQFTPSVHDGIDLVPTSKRDGGNDAAGTPVVALHDGYVFNGSIYGSSYQIIVKDLDSGYEIGYSHVEPNFITQGTGGIRIDAGTEIGKLVEVEKDPTIFGGLAHLHFSLKVPPGSSNYVDPSFLIQQWGPAYDS